MKENAETLPILEMISAGRKYISISRIFCLWVSIGL
jgi:hypothetical protein